MWVLDFLDYLTVFTSHKNLSKEDVFVI